MVIAYRSFVMKNFETFELPPQKRFFNRIKNDQKEIN